MTAPYSIIDTLRARIAPAYRTAQLWAALLDQTERWVPRGAWPAYTRASHRLVEVTDADGSSATLVVFEPNLDVEGAVAVADMELSWRQNVISFLWRKSRTICAGLGNSMLFESHRYADAPDDVVDEVIERELDLLAMVDDETLRRRWFDDRPLVAALRAGIIAEREARISRPVLLGAQPEAPAPAALVVP